MSIYYENPQFANLPLELQNHIYAFMPPHPIKVILEPFQMDYEYDYEDDISFHHYILFTLAEIESERRCDMIDYNYYQTPNYEDADEAMMRDYLDNENPIHPIFKILKPLIHDYVREVIDDFEIEEDEPDIIPTPFIYYINFRNNLTKSGVTYGSVYQENYNLW